MADTEDSREKQRAYLREWNRNWRAANREKYNAQQRAWRLANIELARGISRRTARKYIAANPGKASYWRQKTAAIRRGIAFLLTFQEWTEIWLDSGKWDQRGRRRGQYCMARHGDVGPYATGNVRICTNQENSAERDAHISTETRKRRSDAAKVRWETDPRVYEAFRHGWDRQGRKHSAETRQRMSEVAKVREAAKRARRHDTSGL